MTVIDRALLNKYNVAVPRYTSYPTVPYWKEGIDTVTWMDVFKTGFDKSNESEGISLYIHLPFCESLCTYCGCNKKITGNHSVEQVYINAIHKEWAMYRSLMSTAPVIRELHLGGGTPTFFSPANLELLLRPILDEAVMPDDHEFSFEGHPNNTTAEHLKALYDLGFRRVSYGVQDNDPEVQRIINRVQPFENVQKVTEMAREIGYRSVNFDLIYGLPRQTLQSISRTIEQTISLRPDRIAFYSYAHVPWTSRGQRLFDENDLPSPEGKLAMYLAGKRMLEDHGYHDVGMDHFALGHDDLYVAQQEGRLHRNFMGYTTQRTDMLLGLGVSAISTAPGAYAQNDKALHNYYADVNSGSLPVKKGIFPTADHRRFGGYIRDISCKGRTSWQQQDADLINRYAMPQLRDMEADGLVTIDGSTVIVTPIGRNFIRNICSAFDIELAINRHKTNAPLFSKAV